MIIAIRGASGFIGKALSAELHRRGHSVMPLTRNEFPHNGTDIVFNLGGENIAAGRWTAKRKSAIWDSRVGATNELVVHLGTMTPPPSIFLCASAIGIYGDHPELEVNEGSSAGHGFLADTCRAWEQAAATATAHGIRTIQARMGMVLHPDGGALAKMMPAFKLGLGGRLGDGNQWVSWISRHDCVEALIRLVEDDRFSGPVNLVSPNPLIQKDFASALGRFLNRSTFSPIPPFVLKLLFGEMAQELLLAGQRVVPGVLEANGFKFRDHQIENAWGNSR